MISLSRLVELIKARRTANPLSEDSGQGAMINRAQYDKSLCYIKIATAEVASVATSGGPAIGPGLDGGLYMQPTVLTGVRPDAAIVQEEVFGPVLSVSGFDTEQEALAIATAFSTADRQRLPIGLRPRLRPLGGARCDDGGHPTGHWLLQPARLVPFWAKALDYVPAPPLAGHRSWREYYLSVGVPETELPEGGACDRVIDPAGTGPAIWFQIVPEPKSIKNRLHLDVQVGAGRGEPVEERRAQVDARVSALAALGATVLCVHDGESAGHYGVTLADPEGNAFCVA